MWSFRFIVRGNNLRSAPTSVLLASSYSTTRDILRDRFSYAVRSAFGDQCSERHVVVGRTSRAEFGDYQCNVALSLATDLGLSPHQVAQMIKSHLQKDNIIEDVDVAKNGFLNVRFNRSKASIKFLFVR